jgi:hypothetical protein
MKSSVWMIMLVIVSALILSHNPIGASDPNEKVTLGASATSAGRSTSIVHGGTSVYLRLQFVDQHVNRLRITGEGGRIFYDGVPRANETIFLPPAAYQATVWSSYGSSPDMAIRASFTNEAPRQTATSRPNAAASSSSTPYQTPYAAPGYNQNYYYRNRYYTNNPGQTGTPASHPTSVLDPNYIRQQKSVISTYTATCNPNSSKTKTPCPVPTRTKPH